MKNFKIILVLAVFVSIVIFAACGKESVKTNKTDYKNELIDDKTLVVFISPEQERIKPVLEKWQSASGYKLVMVTKKSNHISMEISSQNPQMDAFIVAQEYYVNSVDPTNSKAKDLEQLYVSLPVMLVRSSIADRIGLNGNELSIQKIIDESKTKSFRFGIPNPRDSNFGLMFFLGLSYNLTGATATLKNESLQDESKLKALTEFLKTIDHSAESSDKLKELFLKTEMGAMATYEFNAFDIIKEQRDQNVETSKMFYISGLPSVMNATLGYLDRGNSHKKELYESFHKYLKSESVKKELSQLGCRTGVNGTFDTNPNNYDLLTSSGFGDRREVGSFTLPSKEVVDNYVNAYDSQLRKPIIQISVLDSSKSMDSPLNSEGKMPIELVKNTSKEMLDIEKAKSLNLFYGPRDQRILFFFDGSISEPIVVDGVNSSQIESAKIAIDQRKMGFETNIFGSLRYAYEYLAKIPNLNEKTSIIIFMTDGGHNVNGETIEGVFRAREAIKAKWGNQVNVILIAIGFGAAGQGSNKSTLDQLVKDNGVYIDGNSKPISEILKEVAHYH